MLEPVAEATKEELKRFFSCLVLKASTRRCHVGVLKENLLSAKTTTKSLLKPHIELVALVILRVPHVLTVALLIFYLPSRGLLRVQRWFLHRDRRVVWVSWVAAWGNTEQAGAN